MNSKKIALIAAIVFLLIGGAIGYKIAYYRASMRSSAEAGMSSSGSEAGSSTPNAGASVNGSAVKGPSGSITIPVSIVSLYQNSSTSPSVSIEYPQFPSLPASFNAAVSSAVSDRLADFKKNVSENEAARTATAGAKGELSGDAYSFIATWEEAQINSRYVSFIIRFDSYIGGANDVQEIQTFNYDRTTGRMVSLGDLFPNDPSYLKTLSAEARQQLTDSMNAASGGNIDTDMLDAGTAPAADSFQYFTFTDYQVNIYFPKYAVAPGSYGEQKVTIPRNN